MSPEQFAIMIAELHGIRMAMYVAAVLMLLVLIIGTIRLYRFAESHTDSHIEDAFNHQAKNFFEKNRLDELTSACREMLDDRPNHLYARWYLARAHFLREDWTAALEELATLRRISPDWADNIDPLVAEVKGRMQATKEI